MSEQLSQVPSNTPLPILDGFQLLNTSAEKSVSDEQYCHAYFTDLTEGSAVLKLVSDAQFHHV